MESNYVILFLCGLVMLSYLFIVISRYTKIPSVILLLATGIGLKYACSYYCVQVAGIDKYVQILGTVGLIMIVLEASLDLHVTRSKLALIRNSLLSSILLLAVSVIGIAGILYYWLHEAFLNSVVYAIPLSIMSSSIVIPSVGHLQEAKKEFLVYEASFSDIIGILVFNFFTMHQVLSWQTGLSFAGSILGAVLFSIVFSLILIYLLSRISISVKFFLVFSVLIFIYVGGKMLHLPSLIIIMCFGLLINNWDIIRRQKYIRFLFLKGQEVAEINTQISSITAESAFVIRTFFFVAFGFSIDVAALLNTEVVLVGSMIVLILLLARFILLKMVLRSNIFPEVMMVPRGLITILLFYIIPENLRLQSFNNGVLSFVVLVTSALMMLGLLFYRQKGDEAETTPPPMMEE